MYNSRNTPFLKKLQHNRWIVDIFEASNGDLFFALERDGFAILRGDKPQKFLIETFFKELPTSFHNEQPDHHYIPYTSYESEYERLTVVGFREDAQNQIHIFTNLGEYLLTGNTSLEKII